MRVQGENFCEGVNSVRVWNVVGHSDSGDNIAVLHRDRGFRVDPRMNITKRSFIFRVC